MIISVAGELKNNNLCGFHIMDYLRSKVEKIRDSSPTLSAIS